MQHELITHYLNDITPLSAETLDVIMSSVAPARLEKDEFFVRQGEIAKDIAFLEDGVVRAFFTNKDGKEYNKTFFSGPAMIGSYVSLITQTENQLPQQALTACKIWRIDFQTIEAHAKTNIELERLRRKIAERFFVGNEKKQLEMALLDANDRYQIFKQEHPGLEDQMAQYHIASYLGISATQLSRIRQKSK